MFMLISKTVTPTNQSVSCKIMESHPRPTQERINELKKAALSGEIPQGEGSIQSAEERARQIIEERGLQEQLERSQAHGEALVEYAKRSQEADQARHQAAIEERKIKGDVRQLNDLADLEIFGSRGRTYRHPTTGQIIADKTHPYKGLLEKMREEPGELKHRPQPYRNAEAQKREIEAKKYEKDLLELIDKEGLELCQAKLVMDLRRKDSIEKPKLRKKLETDGGRVHNKDGQPITPAKKTSELYKKLDKERIKTVKNEGVFTLEEYYEAKKNGEINYYSQGDASVNDEGGTGSESSKNKTDEDVTTKKPETKPETREEWIQGIERLLASLKEKGLPGATSGVVMKPIKKSVGRVDVGQVVEIPEFLKVRDKSSGYSNLTRLAGHARSGIDIGWTIHARQKNAPKPAYFDEREEKADYKPWSEHIFITPNGKIYNSFIRASHLQKNEEGAEDKEGKKILNKIKWQDEKFILDEQNSTDITDFPINKLEIIYDYLKYRLKAEDSEKVKDKQQSKDEEVHEQKTEVLPVADNNPAAAKNEDDETTRRILLEEEAAHLSQAINEQHRITEEHLEEEKGLREELGKRDEEELLKRLKGSAVWKNQSHDTPVEVEGYWGTEGGRHYMKVKDSVNGIPLDELVFSEDRLKELKNIIEGKDEDGDE